jgi:hypothetical protein
MKTYLTETTLGVVAALLLSTAGAAPANAGFLNDLGQFVVTFGTAHEQDGYRDTGCDPAFQVDMGGYSNNPTCPTPPGATDDLTPTPVVVEEEEEEEEEEDGEGEDPVDPPAEECKGEDCGA